METIAFAIPESVIVREGDEIAGIALSLSQALSDLCETGQIEEQDAGLVARLQVTPKQKQQVVWMLEHWLHVPLLEVRQLSPAEHAAEQAERDGEADRWD